MATIQFILQQCNSTDINSADRIADLMNYENLPSFNSEVVKLLLGDPQIDVNKGFYGNETLLHLAANNGETEVAKLLLEFPAIDMNKVDQLGFSILASACFYGNALEIVKMLLEKPEIDKVRGSHCLQRWTVSRSGP